MQTDARISDSTSEYDSLLQFVKANPKISYASFDDAIMQSVNLFVIPKDEHFRTINKTLDKIVRALPSLKRIFTKPITRLKDVDNVLQIESVKVINNRSVTHISRHSELWGDVTDQMELKPRKLLTIDRQEDYAIYENVAFAHLVNYILSYVHKNMLLLKDVMYSFRDLHFNLLERTNHLNYFLALGKLHLGYSRGQEKYHNAYERCLEKLQFIERSLRSKLHSNVYRFCKKFHFTLELKKTNVFRLQKDYQQVYSLLKWFSELQQDDSKDVKIGEVNKSSYSAYCNLLSVFAISNFNFTFGNSAGINLDSLKTRCTYKKWSLTLVGLGDDGTDGILFTFRKDKTYRICLFYANSETDYTMVENIKSSHFADEYLFANPTDYGQKNSLYLSLFDVDSFRRIQQLVLRGMIYSDETRSVCPFCGSPLLLDDGVYHCEVCRMQIFTNVCPVTEQTYFATKIKTLKIERRKSEELLLANSLLLDKFMEAKNYFRNVTALSNHDEIICPYCNKVHK